MRPTRLATRDHGVPFRNLVLDRVLQVGKCGPRGNHKVPERLPTEGGLAARRMSTTSTLRMSDIHQPQSYLPQF